MTTITITIDDRQPTMPIDNRIQLLNDVLETHKQFIMADKCDRHAKSQSHARKFNQMVSLLMEL